MPLLVLEMKSVYFLFLTRISLFFLSTKTIFLLSISDSGTLQVFIHSGPSDEDLMFHSNSSESRWGKFSQSVETSKPFQVLQTDLAVTLEPRNIIYIFTCSLKNSCWSRQRLAEDSLPTELFSLMWKTWLGVNANDTLNTRFIEKFISSQLQSISS